MIAGMASANPLVLLSGSPPAAGGQTPRASFALDALGGAANAQVYDAVAASWVGGACDTADFSSGYLVANSTTDRCYIPGSYLQKDAGNDGITIKFEYQVNTGDLSLYSVYYDSSGDIFSWRHQNASNTGRMAIRANFGSTDTATWTNTGFAVDTWHTAVVQIDFVAKSMAMTINGSQPAGYTESSEADIADWSTLAGNFYLGYVASGTNTVRLKNLAIYNGLVTP